MESLIPRTKLRMSTFITISSIVLVRTQVNTWVRTSTIEDIVMNVDILSFVLGIRLSITYQPDSRPISIMDSIIIHLYIVNNACCFLNQNSRAACTPMIKGVDEIIMKFYVV